MLGFKLRNIESLAVGWADALRAPVDDAHDGDSHLQHRGVADVGVPIQRLAAAAQVDIAPFLHYVVLVTLLGLVAVAAVHVVIYIVAACCKQLQYVTSEGCNAAGSTAHSNQHTPSFLCVTPRQLSLCSACLGVMQGWVHSSVAGKQSLRGHISLPRAPAK